MVATLVFGTIYTLNNLLTAPLLLAPGAHLVHLPSGFKFLLVLVFGDQYSLQSNAAVLEPNDAHYEWLRVHHVHRRRHRRVAGLWPDPHGRVRL